MKSEKTHTFVLIHSAFTGETLKKKEVPEKRRKEKIHNKIFSSDSRSAESSTDEDDDDSDGTEQWENERVVKGYTQLLQETKSLSRYAKEPIIDSNVGTYDVLTRSSLLAQSEASLARNIGAMPSKAKRISRAQMKFGAANSLVAVDRVKDDGSCSVSTVTLRD